MSMTVIEHIEVGSGGAASIEFTSIPADYTDLCLKLSSQSENLNTSVDIVLIQFNSVASGYSAKALQGLGSSVNSFDNTDGFILWTPESGTSAFANTEVYIPNYAGSENKSYSVDTVSEKNATDARQILVAGLWSNTAAITSIKMTVANYDFSQYSSATLYGITAGSDGTTTVS